MAGKSSTTKLPPMADGQRYGRLVVLSRDGVDAHHHGMWRFICDCGSELITSATNVRSGGTNSCGCLRSEMMTAKKTTHGMTYSAEYNVWSNMITRCVNTNQKGFEDYGGRGIIVCEQWRHNFEHFLADMGKRPSSKHQIDRINNDGNYEPDNCRWATKSQQMTNRRNTRMVVYNGRKIPLADAARESGIGYKKLIQRLDRGWSDERALTPEG